MRAEWWSRPLLWVELFAVSNVAFLAVDIYVAHSMNQFRQPADQHRDEDDVIDPEDDLECGQGPQRNPPFGICQPIKH